MSATTRTEEKYDLQIDRVFRAPRELVFEAWTRPEMVAQWWGPKGFTCTIHAWDARPGGNILLDMHGPNEINHAMSGQFKEFDPPSRIIFSAAALDIEGKPMFENLNSLQFEEMEGGTRVTLDVKVTSATEVAPQYLNGMRAGWSSSLDRLAELVENSQF